MLKFDWCFLLRKCHFLFMKVVIVDAVTIDAALCHQCAQVCCVNIEISDF